VRQAHRPLGSTIAIALTLVALVLAGLWVWWAAKSGAASPVRDPLDRQEAEPNGGERFNADERRALENVLEGKRPRHADSKSGQKSRASQ